MLSKLLQEQAALYVAGVMTAQQREQFELVIEFHDELREFAGGLAEIGTVITLATLRRGDAVVPESAMPCRHRPPAPSIWRCLA